MLQQTKTQIRTIISKVIKTPENISPDFGEEDKRLISAVRPYTMTTPERLFALTRAVEYVVQHELPGDIVECGVWRGGSMMAVALTLMRLEAERTLHLFDTFEGMPPPSHRDVTFTGQSASKLMEEQPDKKTAEIWAYSSLAEVKQNLQSTGYPERLVQFHKGLVEDTIPAGAPPTIALLRLDTDWYESTRHELVHLYPRLISGGVLIIDDYGHWEGARKAVDEFLAENQLRILLNRIDYTGRIAIKP
jgi:hypothetical protein